MEKRAIWARAVWRRKRIAAPRELRTEKKKAVVMYGGVVASSALVQPALDCVRPGTHLCVGRTVGRAGWALRGPRWS